MKYLIILCFFLFTSFYDVLTNNVENTNKIELDSVIFYSIPQINKRSEVFSNYDSLKRYCIQKGLVKKLKLKRNLDSLKSDLFKVIKYRKLFEKEVKKDQPNIMFISDYFEIHYKINENEKMIRIGGIVYYLPLEGKYKYYIEGRSYNRYIGKGHKSSTIIDFLYKYEPFFSK